jgi:hypothetical protein
MEVRMTAATALAMLSHNATSCQSAASASCFVAVVAAGTLVPALSAATHSPLCQAFHTLSWQQQSKTVLVGEGDRL